jgi:hypothetical protein
MKLNFKQINLVNHSDWDDLVSDVFGKPYRIREQDGGFSYGTHIDLDVPDYTGDFSRTTVPDDLDSVDYGVSFLTWLNRDPKEWKGDPDDEYRLHTFWHRIFYPNIQYLANELNLLGYIPKGQYRIYFD